MEQLEQRVDALLGSPVGCAFVLDVAASDYPLEHFAIPMASFSLGADSVEFCDVHRGDLGFQELALRQGQGHRDVARRILEHPAFAWWFAPIDLDNQVWTSPRMHHGLGAEPLELFDLSRWREPASPPDPGYLVVQKPDNYWQRTSTWMGGSTSECTTFATGACDHICAFPLACWHLEMPKSARVYEITGPEDWHNLCRRYPARAEDGRLTPDWGRAAADWDGVHLTFGGLLSCEQNRYERDGEWSMHQFWHTESTQWLRRLDIKTTRLPDCQGNHNPHHFNANDFDGELVALLQSAAAQGDAGVFGLGVF